MGIHDGHRARVRAEFLANGLAGFSDIRALELLLFYSRAQGDVNPLAHTLLDTFGSLAGVFSATTEQLMSVPGVGENTAVLIRLISGLGARYHRDRADVGVLIRTAGDLRDLLFPYFFGARSESIYLVALDAKRKLLGVKKLSEGVTNAASVTARLVVETAIALNASLVVLAHNHTSEIATPSQADVSITLYLEDLLQKLGIQLLDHVIIVEDDMVSMRESGLFSRSPSVPFPERK